jgi:hypothetical protein
MAKQNRRKNKKSCHAYTSSGSSLGKHSSHTLFPRRSEPACLPVLSRSASLACILCCRTSIMICRPTGDISEDEAGDGVIPIGGRNIACSTTLRSREREPLMFERRGVEGSSFLTERPSWFSFLWLPEGGIMSVFGFLAG